MGNYLVKLKPVNTYFFGSEEGFTGKDFGRKNDNQTYLIKSRKFPQQTSILGMIRKEVLFQAKNFEMKDLGKYSPEDIEKMKELIGSGSFDITAENQSFGKIRKISPVMIYNSNSKEFYTTVPKDHKLSDKDGNKLGEYSPFELQNTEINSCFGKLRPFKKEEYNAKEGLSSEYMSLKTKKLISPDDVFIEVQKTGNAKEKHEEAFYKQYSYKLEKSYVFAFYLELEDDFELEDTLVELGKERSVFNVTFEKTESTFDEECIGVVSDEKILLMSDSYVSETPDIEYAIKNEISFRNIATNSNGKRNLKERYNFWEAGSVIYVQNSKEKEEIITKLQNKNLNQIGYNTVL